MVAVTGGGNDVPGAKHAAAGRPVGCGAVKAQPHLIRSRCLAMQRIVRGPQVDVPPQEVQLDAIRILGACSGARPNPADRCDSAGLSVIHF